jgi:hypothetical protein
MHEGEKGAVKYLQDSAQLLRRLLSRIPYHSWILLYIYLFQLFFAGFANTANRTLYTDVRYGVACGQINAGNSR